MSPDSSYVSALSPEYVLLGLIDEQPAHGYELHQRLAAEFGQGWRLRQSQVYNMLKRLEKNGLITGEVQEQDSYPSRRRFQLTRAGEEHFEQWLLQPSGCSSRAMRIHFLTRLHFAGQRDPQLAARLLDEQLQELEHCLQRLEEQNNLIPASESYNRMSAELRLSQLQALLTWLQEHRKLITN